MDNWLRNINTKKIKFLNFIKNKHSFDAITFLYYPKLGVDFLRIIRFSKLNVALVFRFFNDKYGFILNNFVGY